VGSSVVLKQNNCHCMGKNSLKYLILCSAEKRKPYGCWTSWVFTWANNHFSFSDKLLL